MTQIQYDLRTGFPDLAVIPQARLSEIAAGVIQSGAGVQYGDSLQGKIAAREVIAPFIGDMMGIPAAPDDIMLTNGALGAIDLVARALTQPGDVVLVEDPTFFYVVNVLRMSHVEVVGVPMLPDGIDLERLEELAQQYGERLRLVYVIPSYHNPTGYCATAANRQKLVELAERYDFHILEDATYQPLYFDAPPPPLVKHYDEAGDRVLTVSSVSKIMMPSLRLGWIWANQQHLDGCLKFKADSSTSSLTSEIVAEYIKTGELPAQIDVIRAVYRRKLDVMAQKLTDHAPDWLTWERPGGGFFIWATLPDELPASKMHAIANQHGVDFMPGGRSFASGSPDCHMRLCFTWLTDDDIAAGTALLCDCLQTVAVQA